MNFENFLRLLMNGTPPRGAPAADPPALPVADTLAEPVAAPPAAAPPAVVTPAPPVVVTPPVAAPPVPPVAPVRVRRARPAPRALVAQGYGGISGRDPRRVSRDRLEECLRQAAAEGPAGPAFVVAELAKTIEVSCYNAAIRISKRSEKPPQRTWKSPEFVSIYSLRVGVILLHLDPVGASVTTYGPALYRRLVADPAFAAAIGNMSERELCPDALRAEREEIARRACVGVVMKESTLYQCPYCHARKCTWISTQRRSLDEAADIKCTCLNCNKSFTGRN
jgi:hypothetical protein